jgi:hypothetical protein
MSSSVFSIEPGKTTCRLAHCNGFALVIEQCLESLQNFRFGVRRTTRDNQQTLSCLVNLHSFRGKEIVKSPSIRTFAIRRHTSIS